LPYFIPMPLSPIGTMGAVIVMAPGMGNRRSLFDIAVSGPLAGLVPALLCCILGLRWSEVVVLGQQQV
ncbi:MAG: site-2 protease family protein, partial [Planctomycetales bacterium]|nr:site-2 protease family protein [Planctomycetales bacterium]